MNPSRILASIFLVVGLLASTALALTIETVPVGNLGNAGELSGEGAGGLGPDRICGAVDYEYRIGKYEVTAGQYTEFLNKMAGVDTYGLYNANMWSSQYGCKIERYAGNGTLASPYQYRVAADWANRPVNYVSFWDSCRFANWLHNGQPTGLQGAGTTETGAYTLNGYTGLDGRTIQRNPNADWVVPSEDEWYKAAYHKNDGVTGNYFDYPTGSDTAPGQDMADVSGNNANHYTAPYVYPIDSGKYTTVVGEFQNSASPYGTFDQGGNVWEWNEAVPDPDAIYGYRGLRAGSFFYIDHDMRAATRNMGVLESYIFGFRIAYVPEPATLLLLALGGLALMRRR